jgi:hypothetical protein
MVAQSHLRNKAYLLHETEVLIKTKPAEQRKRRKKER